MYIYDETDRSVVEQRVLEFEQQVERRLKGEIDEDSFKPLRLMNGLYLQLHGYMLRVAIPYGTLSSTQLRTLALIADKYDRGYGHFTTRQNIQYNWPRLIEVPSILRELAKVDMHAIQTSGNCIRNVTADPYAGVAADETEDPRIVGEIIRQWSTLHPEFSFLPRKFKIAVTGAEVDRAALAIHDVGIRIRPGPRYEVWAGGGQGRTPVLAQRMRSDLSRKDLLTYLDALMRVYNMHGRRDNKYKARIKILVRDLGPGAFRDQVEAEWVRVREEAPELAVTEAQWERVARWFGRIQDPSPRMENERQPADPRFQRWLRRNTRPHRVSGFRIVDISLKPHGGIPGDANADQMRRVADLADRYSQSEVRVTYQQNLVLPYVPEENLYEVWKALVEHGLGTSNRGLISDIIACPGLDYCNLANARAIPIAQAISARFEDREDEIGELAIHISGCINACGHHHTGHIGILGIDKRGEEAYQVAIGGSASEKAKLARIVGPAVSAEKVPEMVEALVNRYLSERHASESFLETISRLGEASMKEAVREIV